MPERIERYQRQIGVNDKTGFRPVLPNVQDGAGAEIRQLGKTLLQAAEPTLQKKAVEAAKKDAGELTYAKGLNGELVEIGERRKGYGLVYFETLDNIMTDRRQSIYQADIEERLTEYQAEHMLNPAAFLDSADGFAEGMVEMVAPEDRPFVEATLNRERTQRMNALVGEKRRRDYNNAVQANDETRNARLQVAENKLKAAQTPEAWQAAVQEYSDAWTAWEKNAIVLQNVDEEGAEALQMRVSAEAWDEFQFAKERIVAGQLLPLFDSEDVTDEELLMIERTMEGDDYGDIEIMGSTSAEWKALFVTPQMRNLVGRRANGINQDRLSARRAAESAERHKETIDAMKEQAQATNAVAKATRQTNFVPENGTSFEAHTAAMESFRQWGIEKGVGGSVADIASIPEGRREIVSFLQTNGYAPEYLDEYIAGNLTGEKLIELSPMVQSMRDVMVDGTLVGVNYFNNLPQRAQMTLVQDWALIRMGKSHEERKVAAEKMARSQLYSMSDIHAAAGGSEQYKKDALNMIASELDMDASQARWLLANKDFSNYMRAYAGMYDGDIHLAMKTAAQHIGMQWASNKLFVGGVAPKSVSRRGATARDYDTALRPEVYVANKTGATFSNGRAKLEPIADDNTRNVGMFRIVFYDKSKRVAGYSRAVDLDQFYVNYAKKTAANRKAEADALMELAERQQAARARPLSKELQDKQDNLLRGVGR